MLRDLVTSLDREISTVRYGVLTGAVVRPVTPFSTFALLYMTALFLELAERWTYPVFTLLTLVLVAVLLLAGITRVTFLLFLVVTTAQFLLVQFPDVANHVNVAIYCNILMASAIVYSLVRRGVYPTDENAFEAIRPLLQLSMILVYALAGFHKLNADFFDPAVSCVADLIGDLTRMGRSRVVGVPTRLVLLIAMVLLAQALLSASFGRRVPASVRAGVFAATLLAAVLAFELPQRAPSSAARAAILAMALVVVLWELIGGVLLAVPWFQAPVLAFSWAMHATLALIGFVDFGALALALLFSFVPRPYRDLVVGRLRLPLIDRAVPRVHVYFVLCVLAGISAGLGRRLLGGLLFNFAALIFMWPLVAAAVTPRPKTAWTGVAVAGRLTPRWLFLFPVVLLLHGLTSYLGLRTAGNFTMFSNLRTEGAVSNHFLLGGNPLKLWHYQEDVVRIIRVDDRRARIGYQYQALQGNLLPVVEFRKLIYGWTRAGATIPMTFEYRGTVHSTGDVTTEPQWRTSTRDWEMRLLDFRVIQRDGPNECRW
jgi:hypothetical protein